MNIFRKILTYSMVFGIICSLFVNHSPAKAQTGPGAGVLCTFKIDGSVHYINCVDSAGNSMKFQKKDVGKKNNTEYEFWQLTPPLALPNIGGSYKNRTYVVITSKTTAPSGNEDYKLLKIGFEAKDGDNANASQLAYNSYKVNGNDKYYITTTPTKNWTYISPRVYVGTSTVYSLSEQEAQFIEDSINDNNNNTSQVVRLRTLKNISNKISSSESAGGITLTGLNITFAPDTQTTCSDYAIGPLSKDGNKMQEMLNELKNNLISRIDSAEETTFSDQNKDYYKNIVIEAFASGDIYKEDDDLKYFKQFYSSNVNNTEPNIRPDRTKYQELVAIQSELEANSPTNFDIRKLFGVVGDAAVSQGVSTAPGAVVGGLVSLGALVKVIAAGKLGATLAGGILSGGAVALVAGTAVGGAALGTWLGQLITKKGETNLLYWSLFRLVKLMMACYYFSANIAYTCCATSMEANKDNESLLCDETIANSVVSLLTNSVSTPLNVSDLTLSKDASVCDAIQESSSFFLTVKKGICAMLAEIKGWADNFFKWSQDWLEASLGVEKPDNPLQIQSEDIPDVQANTSTNSSSSSGTTLPADLPTEPTDQGQVKTVLRLELNLSANEQAYQKIKANVHELKGRFTYSASDYKDASASYPSMPLDETRKTVKIGLYNNSEMPAGAAPVTVAIFRDSELIITFNISRDKFGGAVGVYTSFTPPVSTGNNGSEVGIQANQ